MVLLSESWLNLMSPQPLSPGFPAIYTTGSSKLECLVPIFLPLPLTLECPKVLSLDSCYSWYYVDGLTNIPLLGSSLVLYANDLLLHKTIFSFGDFIALQDDVNSLA